MIKKLIPVLVAIVLICVIGAIYVTTQLLGRYSYSKEIANLNEYYGITKEDEIPIMHENDMLSERGKIVDNTIYITMDTVKNYFTDRFYENSEENILLYTTPTDIIKVTPGEESTSYFIGDSENSIDYKAAFYSDDNLFIALEYVKLFVNCSYEVFEQPKRMQINTKWDAQTVANINKDTQVRTLGGIKCPILAQLKKGDQVTVIKQDETWTEVKTKDMIIGYVETKRLSNIKLEEQIAVNEVPEMDFSNRMIDKTIVLGWHQVFSLEGNNTLSSVITNSPGLNVISPTWFFLNDAEGNFTSNASTDYVTYAHNQGIEVWALVNDIDAMNSETVKSDMLTLLSSSTKRANLINKLISVAKQYNLDGINIDFEHINKESGPHFVQFLRELSIETRKEQLILSVDNYVPNQGNSYYNRKEQGLVADYVVIMGYDEHWAGSQDAGSVASIGFVENGIMSTMEEGVPANKIINAVPFYTRVWGTKGTDVTSSAIGMLETKNWISKNNISTVWDEETCQYYGEIEKDNTLYQVWIEDEKSLEVKLNIMKKHGVAGVAAWKLGLEDPSIWKLIQTYSNME